MEGREEKREEEDVSLLHLVQRSEREAWALDAGVNVVTEPIQSTHSV